MSSGTHREGSLDLRIKELSPEKRAIYERLASSSGDPAGRMAPIERRPVASPAPLSFAQQRLWVLDQLMPGMPLFNLSGAIGIAEAFDEKILERSINELVRRHESLRTTFQAVNGEPVQEILPELHIPLRTIDLRSLPEDACDAEARRLLAEEGEAPFDLATGPLLRTLLVRTTDTESVFHVVTHHIISDAWSIDTFWNELSAIWSAFEAGEPSPLPELPLQYADFAVWERDRLRGPILAELVSYWKNQLAGLPVMELRTDWPRPAIPSGRGSVHYAVVPAPVVRRLRALGRREGATLFMVLLAAFETLLARYTGEDDVVVGTFTANRDRTEIEGLIGFFVNALVLRADLSGRPTFRELLRQVRTTALDAYSHQEMPFARLIHELSPERDLSRNPLFQVAFQLLNTPGGLEEEAEEDELEEDILDLPRTTAVLDLMCTIHEVGERVEAELEYNTDLFRADTIERMAAHYVALLEAIARDPDQAVHELPLVDAAARRRIVEEWNRRAAPYEGGGLVSLFEEQVSLRPDAEAVRFDGGVMTYAELDEHASRLAAQLLVHGAREEVAVGVSLDRSPALVVALLAVLKAGAAYVPLDPSLPRERLGRIVEDAGIELIVSRRALAGKLPATAHVVDVDALDEQSSPSVPRPEMRPDALACVIYTSGSTGKPKGVAIEQRQLLNRLRWMWQTYPFSDGEVACQKTGVAFVDSLWELLGPLLQGVPTVIVSEESARDPDSLVEVLDRERVTRILLVPSLLRSLVERHGDLERRLPDLTLWLASGEELPAVLVKQFEAQLPHAVLCNIYGASEAWDATCYDPRDGGALDGLVPIGRPIANMRAYVLDGLLEPVPPGIPGELHVGGAGVARGYVRDPALTAATFVPDPFSPEPGARLYRTGDLTRYREDGSIEFLGRLDHQVKLRGLRVELGEIEAALEQHPTVRRAVVQLWEDVGSEPRLVAYVVPEPGDGSADDRNALAWRRFLRRTLPDYMLPAAFVTLSTLPFTPTGKLDRRALPPPDGAISLLARSYVAPRTPLEADLAAIWSELLGVERVGIHDSFFDLGGHSLLGIRVLSRVQESFRVAMSARVIFETPTVAGLAARIASAQARGDADETPPIIPLSREEHTAMVVLDAGPGSELAFADDGQP